MEAAAFEESEITVDESARYVSRIGLSTPDESAGWIPELRDNIRLLTPSWPAVVQVAQENGLSAYDASYLHLALALRVPLATFDVRLAATARALGILASPGGASTA